VLDFYAAFCANRATCLKADGKDIIDLNVLLNGNSNAEHSENTGSVELRSDRVLIRSPTLSKGEKRIGKIQECEWN
jgi:hypothetical protein